MKTQIMVGPAKSGKTKWIIEQCAEHGGYIVCADQRAAMHIQKLAASMGHNIPFPISIGELLRASMHGKNVEQVWIDNMDDCLRCLTDIPIRGMTLGATSELVQRPQDLDGRVCMYCREPSRNMYCSVACLNADEEAS